jgi:septal ring factor EnvC (AmiA/AmiB activator)
MKKASIKLIILPIVFLILAFFQYKSINNQSNINKTKKEISNLNIKITELEKKESELLSEIDKKEDEIKSLNDKITELENDINVANKTLGSLN